MRHLLSTSVFAIGLAFSSQVHAEQWFRMNLDAPIIYGGGSPDLGENALIEFVVDGDAAAARVNGRDLGDINIPISVTGIDSSYTVDIADLPAGATWSGSAILWSPAVAGTYTPSIEVRDENDVLVASQALELVVHPPLTASVPQTAYAVEVGEPLVITPTVANLITDGAVRWGGNLPGWLALDEADGTVTVDTSVVRSADSLVLTAVDQIDLKDASTEPFSVAVNNDIVVHVTSDVSNVTLSSLFGSAWTQNRPKRLVVADGVSIYSTSSSEAAMTTGSNLVNTLTIENHGGIYGGGGAANGGFGGDALVLSTSNVVVNNLGQIWAGGGGGGQGGSGGTGLPTNFSREPASGDTFVSGKTYWFVSSGTASIYWNGTKIGISYSNSSGRTSIETVGHTYYRGAYAEPGTLPNSYRYRIYRTTPLVLGGAGGQGGAGEGYGQGRTDGSSGVAGSGSAGSGGTGGRGGSWGTDGASGATGNPGNATDGTGAGIAGSQGGLPGFAIKGNPAAGSVLGDTRGRLDL